METLNPDNFWLVLALVAVGAFWLGRATGGGLAPEDRAEARMRERADAENLFSSLPPTTQEQVDSLLSEGKTIEAIKRIREETSAGLREAKIAADYRRQVLRNA